MKRNWKAIQANSLIDALRLTKDYARECKNLSVERIADLMAVTHHDLYKWLGNGRMPSILIPAYELACGCHFVSQWLALSAGKLVIDMPRGRASTARDVHALQALLNQAVGQILAFADGQAEAETALGAIHSGMAGLAWHKSNIEKHNQPELALGAE
ncbi:hypothetical protein [uncultured Deefgea sp.]|uniref:hypothetical protein n=1 Tax=uncultured Deefgea sp. TaxID=1304914 RepID=UPI0025931578|nr:hypothetical protein [uncultured Deefgea sp.]